MQFTASAFTALTLVASCGAFSPATIQNTAFIRSVTSLDAKRQPIMAGNWKMNPATVEDAIELASGLTKLLGDDTCPIDDENPLCTEVVVFPPHPFLSSVKNKVEEAGISIGAQSVYFQDSGAFTGSVSASMVKSLGVEYILCGHSERREVFGDDDNAIKRKVLKVLSSGMKPILCIGESQSEYNLGIKNEVISMQLARDLDGVTKEQMADIVIAYEPVWAIGTGLVCGSEAANEVHGFLRTVLAKLYDEDVAQATRIQYGGSVTPESVDELMSMPEVDGCLVGGASLVAEKFGRIINFETK